ARTAPAGADSPGARRDWDTAVGLVLPAQSHPVLADPRYADEPYRDAVRQVADLLSDGGGLDAAAGLADQLRQALGLPDRAGAELPRTLGSPEPVSTTTGTAGAPVPVTTVTASTVPADLVLTPVADTPAP
ncbi:hypothetical protein NGM37_06660, partial [Streptomyces sp. TRM76130]|nr:hypothetical protein [Streptomyces sp. TRM76130]